MAAESGQRPGILEQVLRRAGEFVSRGGLEGVFNRRGRDSITTADKAIYGMSAEGKSAADILKFIASASRNPFNRQLAKLLLKTGIAPKITVGDAKGWKFNAGNDKTYAAAYSPKTNTIALFRPVAAERNVLHELMHAATLKALARIRSGTAAFSTGSATDF